MEEDINIFVPEDKFLQIGKKRFKIWISSWRSLKATDMFNKLKDKKDSINTDYDMYSEWVDICLLLIKQDFFPALRNVGISTIFTWWRRQRITAAYIFKNMDIKELTEFVNDALEPIIGTKKKELEREEKMADAMQLMVEKLTPEALEALLQNSLSIADTKKAM